MARIYIAAATTVTPPASGPLTASAVPTGTPPFIQLEVNLTTGMRTALGTASLIVQRLDPDGVWHPVRGAEPAQISSGGFWTGQDFEVPYSALVRYRGVRADTGTVIVTSVTGLSNGTTSPELSLDVDTPWLVHPGVPSRSVPIVLRTWAAVQRTARRQVMQVIGRSRPVVLTQIRNAPTSSVEVLTETAEQARQMNGLLDDGLPLLLNVPLSLLLGVDTAWVSIGDATSERAVQFGPDPSRVWTLPYDVVDRPVGGQQSTWSYAALRDERLTYAAVRTAYATYADLAAHRPR